MDFSKLPKLSKTAENQPAPDEAAEPTEAVPPELPPVVQFPVTASLVSIGWAEAWISIALGVLILFIFPNTIHYAMSHAEFDANNSVTDGNGNTIPYSSSGFFWSDLGVTIFAAAMILEGIALAAARKVRPLWAAFGLTVAAAVFNVWVIAHTQALTGFPIFCGVGVVILGYMAFTQWRLISALSQIVNR
jgi:hypothetical protein